MLGGSSGMNYMAYVRGHPGDFDAWAEGGATGWSFDDVLPYFKKSEGLAPSDDIVIDAAAHNTAGPLGVSVRAPILNAARASSSTPRWRRASLAATTTGAIVVAPAAWCHCSRHPRGPASDRAPITRSSKVTSNGGRT